MKPLFPLTGKAYVNPEPVEQINEAIDIRTHVYDENIDSLFYDFPEKDDYIQWLRLHYSEARDTDQISELIEKIRDAASTYAPYLEQFCVLCDKYTKLCEDIDLDVFYEEEFVYRARDVFAELEEEICVRIRENLNYTFEMRNYRFNEQPPETFKIIKLCLEKYYVYLSRYKVDTDADFLKKELTGLVQGIKHCSTGVVNSLIGMAQQIDEREGLEIELAKMRALIIDRMSSKHVTNHGLELPLEQHIKTFFANVAEHFSVEFNGQYELTDAEDIWFPQVMRDAKNGVVTASQQAGILRVIKADIDAFPESFDKYYNIDTIIEYLENEIISILKRSAHGPTNEYIVNAERAFKKYKISNHLDYDLSNTIDIDGCEAGTTKLIDDINEYAKCLAVKILLKHNLIAGAVYYKVDIDSCNFAILSLDTDSGYRNYVVCEKGGEYHPTTVATMLDDITENHTLNEAILNEIMSSVRDIGLAEAILVAVKLRMPTINSDIIYQERKSKVNKDAVLRRLLHPRYYWIDTLDDIEDILSGLNEHGDVRRVKVFIAEIGFRVRDTAKIVYNISTDRSKSKTRKNVIEMVRSSSQNISDNDIFMKVIKATPANELTFDNIVANLPETCIAAIDFDKILPFLKSTDDYYRYHELLSKNSSTTIFHEIDKYINTREPKEIAPFIGFFNLQESEELNPNKSYFMIRVLEKISSRIQSLPYTEEAKKMVGCLLRHPLTSEQLSILALQGFFRNLELNYKIIILPHMQTIPCIIELLGEGFNLMLEALISKEDENIKKLVEATREAINNVAMQTASDKLFKMLNDASLHLAKRNIYEESTYQFYGLISASHIKRMPAADLYRYLVLTKYSSSVRESFTEHPEFNETMNLYINNIIEDAESLSEILGTNQKIPATIAKGIIIRSFQLDPSSFGQIHLLTPARLSSVKNAIQSPRLDHHMFADGEIVSWSGNTETGYIFSTNKINENHACRGIATRLFYCTPLEKWGFLLQGLGFEDASIRSCLLEILPSKKPDSRRMSQHLNLIKDKLKLNKRIDNNESLEIIKGNIIEAILDKVVNPSPYPTAQRPTRKRSYDRMSQ